jgi:predicted O-linked N-acetylglucosamine transferase (SPINDLY family)
VRLGYLSADVREHVVMKFFEPVLEAHDPELVEVHLLSATKDRDGTTARLASRHRWCELRGRTLEQQRRRVAELELDAIVELGGHTSEGVLEVLALRLAPLQCTYLGYPGTTGLETIDLRLTDVLVDPPGAERDFVERLARLPRVAWAYPPPLEAAPAAASGRGLVLGSFNRLGKVSPATFELWCRVLARLPESRLVLRASAIDEPEVRARLEAAFAARGLVDRVELRGWVDAPARALAELAEVEVVLDPFPYHGTTTTCDALSVGTPVVSLVGETPASRVAPSLLGAVGLGALAVSSEEAFVSRLTELDARLDDLRRERPERVARYRASALADGRGLARAIERAIGAELELRSTIG